MSQKQFIRTLEVEAKKFFARHGSELIDIILFGSTLTGADKPHDVDILLVFKDKVNHLYAQQLRHALQTKVTIPVEVTSKTYEALFASEFVACEAILSTGYSLIQKLVLSDGLGYSSQVLFTYKLGAKTKSERMRFYYALYGRNSKGILHTLHAQKYTDTVILCPFGTSGRMNEFLSYWKVEFSAVPCLIPSRVL